MDLVLDKDGMRLEPSPRGKEDLEETKDSRDIMPEYKDPRCKGCSGLMFRRQWDEDVQAWHYFCPDCDWRKNKG